MNTETGIAETHFLRGGGEMGRLTRELDWSNHPLGPFAAWPKSLQTTLGIVLHSAFPKFLFWGKDLTCFYNDAFRPSLGSEGKHPAVGKKAREVWPEIWEFIGPLIEGVMTSGDPVYFEDQLVPFYRNGRIEDIYWTFSYSPAYGDQGNIEGVFVSCTETTEKVRSMQALADNRDLLLFAIESAELATWDYDPISDKFTANHRYTEWFGISADEAVDNKKSLAIIAEEDRDKVKAALADALTFAGKKDRFDVTYTIRPKGRPERILRAKGKAYFDENGIAVKLSGTLQDVTEQTHYNSRLSASEGRIKQIVESAPFPIAVYEGRDMRITYANQAVIDLWGKGPDVFGKTFDQVLPELNDLGYLRLLQQVFDTGKEYNSRNERVDLVVNGQMRTFYFNYSYTPLFDSNGKVFGVMNTAADVTDLNLAKKQLEQSEQQLQQRVQERTRELQEQSLLLGNILTNSSNGISVTEMIRDQNGKVIDARTILANEAAVKFTGIPRDIYLAKTATELDPDIMRSEYVKACLKTLETGEPGLIRYFLELNSRWLELTISRMDEEHLIHIFTDVTPVKEAELKIERTVDELRRSNANLEQFAYAASHDLKEPIRKIHFFTDRIKSTLSERLNQTERHYFERMEMASRRMSSLIEDLLAYSQVSAAPRTFEKMDLNLIVAQVLSDLDMQVEHAGATVSCNQLPIVKGHGRQLQQVFQNLIANSLKYARPGVPPVIEIRAGTGTAKDLNLGSLAPDTRFHIVVVKDNGIGFEQKQAERIFNVFTRLHHDSDARGSGIGLSIVRKIIDNHGGFITAEGHPGKGAVFRIALPAKSEDV